MLTKIVSVGIAAALLATGSPALASGGHYRHHYSSGTTTTVTTATATTTTSISVAPTGYFAPWGTTIFDGYGSVSWDTSTGALSMAPKAATQPSETHSALYVSTASLHQPYQISYTTKTLAQLRTGSTPNPWETSWVVFGRTPEGKFKYAILKPNGYGVEIGESLLNDAQSFLFTSPMNTAQFPVNGTYNVVLTARNNIITVSVNGTQYASYTMSAKDQLTGSGQYGFYTEDASVQISNIVATQL